MEDGGWYGVCLRLTQVRAVERDACNLGRRVLFWNESLATKCPDCAPAHSTALNHVSDAFSRASPVVGKPEAIIGVQDVLVKFSGGRFFLVWQI